MAAFLLRYDQTRVSQAIENGHRRREGAQLGQEWRMPKFEELLGGGGRRGLSLISFGWKRPIDTLHFRRETPADGVIFASARLKRRSCL
jgi:hypothetical protein